MAPDWLLELPLSLVFFFVVIGCHYTHIHTTLLTKAWQIQNIDISVRKVK